MHSCPAVARIRAFMVGPRLAVGVWAIFAILGNFGGSGTAKSQLLLVLGDGGHNTPFGCKRRPGDSGQKHHLVKSQYIRTVRPIYVA
jgi:hypothetical protein